MYLELRSGLSPVSCSVAMLFFLSIFSFYDSISFSFQISLLSCLVYPFKIVDENGKTLYSEDVVELLIKLVEEFKKDHPTFLGMKVILTMSRNSGASSWEVKMQRFIDLQQKYPNFVIGFDLVGQEDNGKPLSEHVDKLKNISQNGRFFFHAGETNWFSTDADANLIDAILMNTKRVGHGYSLYKHPTLWTIVREKDIALEISPISNQVLRLVADLRNHPATFYISENVPIVVSSHARVA